MGIYTIKLEDAKLHISKGNNKIGKGIWSFSTLPGNSEHLLYIKDKGLLTDIPGTCSKYCEGCFNGGCYAVNSAKLHHNAVIRAWAENTLLLRSGKLFDELDAFITKKNKDKTKPAVEVFRINVSGEIENYQELVSWNNLAKKHENVRFGIYTKNFDALKELCDSIGADQIAENFVINVSEWHGVAKDFLEQYPNIFNVFEYDDSNHKSCELSEEEKARLKKVQHCPAVDAKGHHAKTKDGKDITCDMCQRCYRKTKERTAVYAH